MELIAGVLNISAANKRVAIIDQETANLLGVHSSDRIRLTCCGKEIIAIADVATGYPQDRIWLYIEIAQALGAKDGEIIQVQPAPIPESLNNVRAKLRGERLRDQEIYTIVKDVVEQHHLYGRVPKHAGRGSAEGVWLPAR